MAQNREEEETGCQVSEGLKSTHCVCDRDNLGAAFFLRVWFHLYFLEFKAKMAQNREEETGCQVPEGLKSCVDNCDFFGSPATMNLYSKYYNESVQLNVHTTASFTMASSQSYAGYRGGVGDGRGRSGGGWTNSNRSSGEDN